MLHPLHWRDWDWKVLGSARCTRGGEATAGDSQSLGWLWRGGRVGVTASEWRPEAKPLLPVAVTRGSGGLGWGEGAHAERW